MNIRMKLLVIVLPVLFWSLYSENTEAQADNSKPAEFIKFSGYVKNDFFVDTRQTYAAREGNFLIFPLPEVLDNNGDDINAKTNFNIMAIETRVSASITGPDAFGAKTSGVVEGDFFAQINANINLLRLRHAYLKMKWEKAELLFGQYWHPLFVVSCFPATVSFNTGTPLQPFSRAPQIRGSYYLGNFKLSAMLVSQRDYASVGPNGTDSKYMRDAGFPEVQFQWEYLKKGDIELSFGSGAGYKQLLPQIKTYNNYQATEKVSGMSVNGFIKFKNPKFTIKASAVYLENGSEFLSVSGYAVKDTIDPVKGTLSYAPIRTYCLWTDLHSNGKHFQAGLFSGYTENLGTKDMISGPIYLTGNANIKNLYRISPRFLFISNKTTFAAEIEYTSANYGIPDDHAIPVNTTSVANIRFLFSAIYQF